MQVLEEQIEEMDDSGCDISFEMEDFPDEMKKCTKLEEELDRYFNFLSKLSREELLAIVKYEVYNRVVQEVTFKEEK